MSSSVGDSINVGCGQMASKKSEKINAKVVILPWAFPVEINADRLNNDFFKKGEKRYNRYVKE